MIIRDLYRSPIEDLHKAIVASTATLLRRGVIAPPAEVEAADVGHLAWHPEFDPSLSFIAYEGPEPVAFLVSHIQQVGDTSEAVLSLLGGAPRARHAIEVLLDETMAHWRREGAKRARKGALSLLATEPRIAEDAELIAILKDRGFEMQGTSTELAADLKKLATPKDLAERKAEAQQKGFIIRVARPDELAVIARQYHPRHTRAVTPDFWNLLTRHMRAEATLVVEHRRQIIGYTTFLGWTFDSPRPSLGPHFIDEVHRKGNLDAILVHEALLLAKANAKERVRAYLGTGRTDVHQRAGLAVAARFCHEAVVDLL